jgi:hypothetical protein
MHARQFFRKFLGSRPARFRRGSQAVAPQLRLEPLEDRALLSARVITTLGAIPVANANVNVALSATTPLPDTVESEMSVDINPTNPLNVVGFSHDDRTVNAPLQIFFSMDGGNTWARRLITNTSGPGMIPDGNGTGVRFDPAIKFDANGVLYVAYGFDDNTSTSLIVGHSNSGGAGFEPFVPVDRQNDSGGGIDKWQIATGVDPSTNRQAVYVAYSRFQGTHGVMVAGSNDGGATFTTPVRIDDNNQWSDTNFACPAVGPNGELYVSWVNNETRQILVDRSLGGLWPNDSFGTDVVVRTLNRYMFSNLTPAQPNRGFANGPVLDVDRSGGPRNGNLYLTFVDGFAAPIPAADTGIYLVRSNDRGADGSWTTIEGRGNVQGRAGTTSFLPWVAVDQSTGSVNVAYYTTDGAPDNSQVNVRLATSFDGGNTFKRTNVTTHTSQASSATANRGDDFLEYIGLAVRDSTAQVFWADNRGTTATTFVANLHAYSASVSYRPSGNGLLLILGDDGGVVRDDVITLRQAAANPAFAEVVVNGQTQWAGLWASFNLVLIDAGKGKNVVTIQSLMPSVEKLDILAGSGNDIINVNTAAPDAPVFIDSGGGDDTINIEATDGPLTLTTGNGNSTVNISPNAKSLDNIRGSINATGGIGNARIVINDQSSTLPFPYEVTPNEVKRFSPVFFGLLAGPPITYTSFNGGLTLNAGSGNNSFDVVGTSAGGARISTGPGNNFVLVRAVTGALGVVGQGGQNTVRVGFDGKVENINGNIGVENPIGTTFLQIDDTKNNVSRTVVMGVFRNPDGMPLFGFVTGFGAPTTSVVYDLNTFLKIDGSTNGNDFTIADTVPTILLFGGGPVSTTTLNTGLGSDSVNVLRTTGDLAINLQTGFFKQVHIGDPTYSLDWIQGPISLAGSGTHQAVSISDEAATTSQTVRITDHSVERSGAANITLDNMAPGSRFDYTGSKGGNAITIAGTRAGNILTVFGGAGTGNAFVVDANQSRILGSVLIIGSGVGFLNTAVYDDSMNRPQTYTFSLGLGVAQTLERSGQATVSFLSVNSLILQPGQAAFAGEFNSINVKNVVAGISVGVRDSNGDKVVVGSLAPAIGGTLAGILGFITFSSSPTDRVTVDVDNSGNIDTVPQQVKFTPGDILGNGTSIVGLAPGTISYFLGATSSVTLRGGAASDITVRHTFVMRPFLANTPLTIDGGGGNNQLDYSNYTTDIYVNLRAGAEAATSLAGFRRIQNVKGGASGNDILVGNGGNSLVGGGGRNILIAGASPSALIGGPDDDILIAGTTNYDTNRTALMAIMAQWSRTDLDYATRVANILAGKDNAPPLNATTVHSNGGGNSIAGNPIPVVPPVPGSRDLYFANPALMDVLVDRDPATETLITIT